MLIMDAILETHGAEGFVLWGVAEPSEERLLRLSGDLSERQVGTAMAVLAEYGKGPRVPGENDARDGMELVRRLVAAECVVAPGGLRVRDTATGVTVLPGCCFGLENWRDWIELLDGGEPWFGHDPEPHAEHLGAVIRMWPDAAHPEATPVDIPRAELRRLLGSVQDDLVAFLNSVQGWASCRFACLAPALIARLDEGLGVTVPLSDSP
ncbi:MULTISPECIES: hypothetical protein [Streptomyces]